MSVHLLLVIISFFVNCVCGNFTLESNAIIRQRPTTTTTEQQQTFKVYWNIPSFQCAKHNITFTDLPRKFKIVQNQNDTFRGHEIIILYDPGDFPALMEQRNATAYFYRNGGLPQRGNLTLHLQYFAKHVQEQVPNEFNGIGVIDFESWRPIFRQNFGALKPYKDLSYDYERQMHKWWPNFLIEHEAIRRFEMFARIFMEETLIYVKQLRPNATWGYYAYPYCFNMNAQKEKHCSAEMRTENDRMSWLFDLADGYYPSLYMKKNELTPIQKIQMIDGRITESKRIAANNNHILTKPKILPYFWYRYRDVDEYLSKDDVHNSIRALKSANIDGVILWGSSNDVNTKEKCEKLKNYFEQVFGPVLLNM